MLFGHHFAAISGAGPLVGPILAAQMGYLPGTLWIVLGVIVAGGVQDYLVLFFSMRRNGRSLGQMTRDELGRTGGIIASLGIILIMVILIAVLGVVIINALAEKPLGCLLDRHDDPHCRVHGHLHALPAPRQGR